MKRYDKIHKILQYIICNGKYETVFIEITGTTCCLFQWLCISQVNYELVIDKMDLCNMEIDRINANNVYLFD
jgi:hypothetical protein